MKYRLGKMAMHVEHSSESAHRTWLDPLLRLFILDEHPDKPMLRTVRAQAGFGALLILIQFCFDVLAWGLGLRWVFVDALGTWAGWPLTVAFALLIAIAIAIFERFVLTADTARVPLFRNPAVLARMLFLVAAALVTSIPLEMMIFGDVIDGRINGEIAALREEARAQLRRDVEADLARIDAQLRKLNDDRLAPLDRTIANLEAKILAVADAMQAEEEGRRTGERGQGPRYQSLLSQRKELEGLLDAALQKREKILATKDAESPYMSKLLDERERVAARLSAKLSDAELSQLTQRSLAVPDGFARRWEIMNELEATNPLYGQTKWAIRLVILALGLLVFTTKLFFNAVTVRYYADREALPSLQREVAASSDLAPAPRPLPEA